MISHFRHFFISFFYLPVLCSNNHPDNQRVAGLEGKRVFILFLRKYIIRRAELLDGGVVEPCTFLHFRSDQQAFAFDLCSNPGECFTCSWVRSLGSRLGRCFSACG